MTENVSNATTPKFGTPDWIKPKVQEQVQNVFTQVDTGVNGVGANDGQITQEEIAAAGKTDIFADYAKENGGVFTQQDIEHVALGYEIDYDENGESRIKEDENGEVYVDLENWNGDADSNSTFWTIVENSYDVEELARVYSEQTGQVIDEYQMHRILMDAVAGRNGLNSYQNGMGGIKDGKVYLPDISEIFAKPIIENGEFKGYETDANGNPVLKTAIKDSAGTINVPAGLDLGKVASAYSSSVLGVEDPNAPVSDDGTTAVTTPLEQADIDRIMDTDNPITADEYQALREKYGEENLEQVLTNTVTGAKDADGNPIYMNADGTLNDTGKTFVAESFKMFAEGNGVDMSQIPFEEMYDENGILTGVDFSKLPTDDPALNSFLTSIGTFAGDLVRDAVTLYDIPPEDIASSISEALGVPVSYFLATPQADSAFLEAVNSEPVDATGDTTGTDGADGTTGTDGTGSATGADGTTGTDGADPADSETPAEEEKPLTFEEFSAKLDAAKYKYDPEGDGTFTSQYVGNLATEYDQFMSQAEAYYEKHGKLSPEMETTMNEINDKLDSFEAAKDSVEAQFPTTDAEGNALPDNEAINNALMDYINQNGGEAVKDIFNEDGTADLGALTDFIQNNITDPTQQSDLMKNVMNIAFSSNEALQGLIDETTGLISTDATKWFGDPVPADVQEKLDYYADKTPEEALLSIMESINNGAPVDSTAMYILNQISGGDPKALVDMLGKTVDHDNDPTTPDVAVFDSNEQALFDKIVTAYQNFTPTEATTEASTTEDAQEDNVTFEDFSANFDAAKYKYDPEGDGTFTSQYVGNLATEYDQFMSQAEAYYEKHGKLSPEMEATMNEINGKLEEFEAAKEAIDSQLPTEDAEGNPLTDNAEINKFLSDYINVNGGAGVADLFNEDGSINSAKMTEFIQVNSSQAQETALLKNLMNITANSNSAFDGLKDETTGLISTDTTKWFGDPVPADVQEQIDYYNGKTDQEILTSIMESINNGAPANDVMMYMLNKISGGDPQALIDDLRAQDTNGANILSDKEQELFDLIMQLYGNYSRE